MIKTNKRALEEDQITCFIVLLKFKVKEILPTKYFIFNCVNIDVSEK